MAGHRRDLREKFKTLFPLPSSLFPLLGILGSTFGADSAKYTASSSGKELSKVLVGATEK
ncbi:MAG: hypothetical protein FJ405_07140 [Verrucomicrobia bacterium]|nr:hypothetical protein [Verrucomicrobiota bacterium]